jgi:hypothetical protein
LLAEVYVNTVEPLGHQGYRIRFFGNFGNVISVKAFIYTGQRV